MFLNITMKLEKTFISSKINRSVEISFVNWNNIKSFILHSFWIENQNLWRQLCFVLLPLWIFNSISSKWVFVFRKIFISHKYKKNCSKQKKLFTFLGILVQYTFLFISLNNRTREKKSVFFRRKLMKFM